MYRIAVLASIVALMPCAASAHGVRLNTIPQSYWGTWAGEAASCATEKETIVLSAKTYVGPSGKCTIVYVEETPGAEGPIYAGRFLCSDPAARSAKKSTNVIIRSDKAGISVGPAFDKLVAYQRCLANGGGAKP